MPTAPVDQQNAMVIVLVGLQGLLTVAFMIFQIWKGTRREPPIERELYKDFARRMELDEVKTDYMERLEQLDARHTRAAAEIFAQLRKVNESIGQQSQEFGRSVAAQAQRFETSLTGIAGKIGELTGELNGHIKSEGRK